MSSADIYPRLIRELDELRRQWRWAKVVEGGLLAAAGGLAVLTALVAADNLLQLGIGGRFLLAVGLWGSVAAMVMTWVVRRWLEQRRDDFFAALVEQQHPELHNRLINALQLGRGLSNGSRQIVEAIVQDADKATAEMELGDCLDWRPVRRAGLCAGGALVAIAIYGAIFAPRFVNGLGRVLFPIASIEAYTATQIDVESITPREGTRYPEGDEVKITVDVGGDTIPVGATLMRSTDGKTWRPARMQPAAKQPRGGGPKRRFQFVAANVAASFQFYILAGDDRSPPRRIEVVRRPRIAKWSVEITPPPYAARAPQTQETGEIAALAGSTVILTLQVNKPLRKATLETEAGDLLELQAEKQENKQAENAENTWQTQFVLWTATAKANRRLSGRFLRGPTRYKLQLVDQDGYENARPLWRSLTVVSDQPPSIAIADPGRDKQIKPGDEVPLTIETRDDYGVGEVRVLYRINEEPKPRELARFPHEGATQKKTLDKLSWKIAKTGARAGDVLQYWAIARDRNRITGPGVAESRRYSLYLVAPSDALSKMQLAMEEYAAILEQLIRLQRENRAQTASGVAFESLLKRQAKIRSSTAILANAMKRGALPVATMVSELQELHAGLMAEAIRLLEAGRDAKNTARSAKARNDSLPVQEAIVQKLEQMLRRLQRNDQARRALRRIRKKDQAQHREITQSLAKLVSGLDRLIDDQTEQMSKLEKMPKKPVEELNAEELKQLKQFEEFASRWSKWRKGTIDELSKLPTGFVDDFDLRADVNRVFEEIEAAAKRSKSSNLEVALEDAGTSKATKMLEDLETWMPDSPDALQWVMEEPLDRKPLNMPEMPLPDALEDLIGELLQEADEFDQEADDITSAWGDNLNQAGWGVSDGPISNFSAKGKTGNDLPNKNEVSGRAGDGRRGKSSGQMVGDTARGLEGRKTPARLNNERYEPGKLKEEGRLDPNGATGGGKKAGAGRRGLQGGTPPDFVRDIERLSAKQTGMREKAQQIVKQLDTKSVTGRRLRKAMQLMQSVEKDLRDLRYQDAARKRKAALRQLRSAFSGLDRTTAVQLHQARNLPAQLRNELLQSADEAYPKGYEQLLQNYFKTLSRSEQ